MNRPVRWVGPQLSTGPNANQRPVRCVRYNALGFEVEVWAGATADTTSATCAFGTDLLLARQVTRVFDDYGRRLSETDPNGKTWRWTYDIHSNVASRQTPEQAKAGALVRTAYSYAHGGLLLLRSDTADTVTLERNVLGQITRATTQAPGASGARALYEYGHDAANRLASVHDRVIGQRLAYTWSPGGMLSRLTDAQGRITSYQYDRTGRLTAVGAPNGETVTFGYDAGGRQTGRFFPNGVQSRITWNADGSVASVRSERGSSSALTEQIYEYDGFGRRTAQRQVLGRNGGIVQENVVYAFDELDRLLSDGNTIPPRTYAYDIFGNRVGGTQNGQVFDWTYDLAHRPQSYRVEGAVAGTYLYDDNGRQISRTRGGLVSTYGWDAQDRLTSFSVGGATQLYAYDHEGRRISKTGGGETERRYFYDRMDVYAEYPAQGSSPRALYVFGPVSDDPMSRIPVSATTLGAARYYHADAQGSIVTTSGADGTRVNVLAGLAAGVSGTFYTGVVDGITLTPDALTDGDLTGSPRLWAGVSGVELTFDLGVPRAIEELVITTGQNAFADPADPKSLMLVDLKKQNADFNTAGIEVELSLDGVNFTSVSTVSENRNVVVRDDFPNLVVRFIRLRLTDPDTVVTVAEVQAFTPPSSGGEEIQFLDAWGNTLLGGVSRDMLYGYAGREPDETGLMYYRARYYDPSLGRFISPDPLGDIDGPSPFVYARNNPVQNVDPLGLHAASPALASQVQSRSNYWAPVDFGQTSGGAAVYQPSRVSQGPEMGAFEYLVNVALPILSAPFVAAGASAAAPIMVTSRIVANPVPSTMARVIPNGIPATTLGRPGTSDVFVTGASDVAGMSSKQIAQRLGIPESPTGSKVIEFSTPQSGVASPVFRRDPGFIGGGRTAGGAREFVIPNGPIPANAIIRTVP